eukprot:TRINITY_DN15436_c0_g1_i1.p1 TRINITY_DN15436_c0_g1~~TRINITY_DN15436_c0_g1_i1.p1  ORF type:complete len:472 (-),score=73.01 TRINITY_DN15436_c0_g1_i1:91-1506(-)
MMEDWDWCEVCKRSINPSDRKKHKYTGKHQRLLQDYVPKIMRSMEAVMDAGATEETAMQFQCPLCPSYDPNPSNSHPHSYRHAVWAHLSLLEPHGKNVDRFVALAANATSISPRPHRDALTLSPLQLQKRVMGLLKEQRQQFNENQTSVSASTAALDQSQQPGEPPTLTPISEMNPSSSAIGGVAVSGRVEHRTLVSKNGVLQNPTGSHNGARVWGGGIIKLAPHEWIPWELDDAAPLQQHQQDFQASASHLDQAAHANAFYKPQERKGGIKSVLTRLERDTTEFYSNQGIPTVHSLPPNASSFASAALWLQSPVTSTAATRVPAGGTLHEMAELYRHKLKLAQKNPNRVGAKWANERLRQIQQAIQSQMSSSTSTGRAAVKEEWLPSFGGVWNEGPRSQHKRTFKENQNFSGASQTQIGAKESQPRRCQMGQRKIETDSTSNTVTDEQFYVNGPRCSEGGVAPLLWRRLE